MMTSPQDAKLVLPLKELTQANASQAGSKAANLGELLSVGFPVPDGFVLTTGVFQRFLTTNDLRAESPPETVDAATVPTDVVEALDAAATAFGDTLLAVRSSAVAEDLPDASFAGQYETVLNVQGEEALREAVRRVWASACSARAAAYRAARALPFTAMAVLVQRQVPAGAAGVAFSANPVTGDRHECLVSAVRGLGERLVAGHVTPDEWTVRGVEVVCRRAPEGALTADQARTVAELASRVEHHFGAPQDIEWALAEDRIWLLQARPITALPEWTELVPILAPPGFWQRDTHHQPLSPLDRSVRLAAYTDGMRTMFASTGALVDTIEYREIGGWLYLRVIPLGGKEPPSLPGWLQTLAMLLLTHLVPAFRSRMRTGVDWVRTDQAGRWLERWEGEWRPELAASTAALQAVDLPALSDEALAEHLDRTREFFRRATAIHFLLAVPHNWGLGTLALTCRDLLGWDDSQVFELLAGLSEKSSEPGRRLAELARMVRGRPAVAALITQADAAARLDQVDPEFAAAFAGYRNEYGCRTLGDDVAELSLAERPELLLAQVCQELTRDRDAAGAAEAMAKRRAAAVARARVQLADRSVAERERFERALAFAQRCYPLREENTFSTVSIPQALLRSAALEAGRRLAHRRSLSRRDDVFFLEYPEVLAALREGGDRRQLVARRKGEHAWARAHPGPDHYGRDPGMPPLAGLPPEVRSSMEAMLWGFPRVMGSWRRAHDARADTLEGVAASPGRYRGPVRVVRGEAEFDKLQPGDVLVCPITTPVWSVLFPNIGALVTDDGGILSHPAIIAREYGVPAVVATGNATRFLHDGQIVTVDGDAGLLMNDN